LAWLLTRGQDIAPIPGTRRVSRVEENTAADAVELTPDQLHRLDHLGVADKRRAFMGRGRGRLEGGSELSICS
jgi:aryl-alcohol dehydrogenase-like predicted oxidoreductase